MSPKCVYGEHEMQARCPTMYWSAEKVPCEPDPNGDTSDPDFASLLEREPYDGSRPQAMDAAGAAADYVAVISARRQRDLAKKTSESQAARISSLEGVLRAIRARCHRKDNQLAPFSALADIARLVTETLDPHKPWCRDENHQGPCESRDEGYSDGK